MIGGGGGQTPSPLPLPLPQRDVPPNSRTNVNTSVAFNRKDAELKRLHCLKKLIVNSSYLVERKDFVQVTCH